MSLLLIVLASTITLLVVVFFHPRKEALAMPFGPRPGASGGPRSMWGTPLGRPALQLQRARQAPARGRGGRQYVRLHQHRPEQ